VATRACRLKAPRIEVDLPDVEASERRERRRPPSASDAIRDPRRGWWWRHAPVVRVIATAALVAGAGYLTWRIGWSGRGANLPLYVALLAAELFSWCSLALYTFLAWSVPRRPNVRPRHVPSVDVFVCTYDEPVAIVESTLIGCRAMDLPHTTYLLDDGDRAEMAALAGRLGAVHVTRAEHAHAKAGNVNHALGVTDGELILVLDADHVPLPGILDATVGYFDDPEVALVQTPHDFSNRDSVQHTRRDRNEQSLFYRVIAPAKDRHNAMFWCGSAAVIRRAALEQVGGVLTDTVAEDFHTTIAMHARGWQTRYHDEILVQGRAPHDLSAFLLQRARWARGNLGVFRTQENPLTCHGLSRFQRLSYFASLFNYFSGLQRFTLLAVLIATLVSGALPMHASIGVLLAVWLPWCLLAHFGSIALGRGTLGPLDSTRYGLMTMGIFIRGVVAMVFRSAGHFAVTPKQGVDRGGVRVFRMLGLCTAVGLGLATAMVLRLLDVAGLVDLPALPGSADVIVMVLGAWELFGFARTLVPLVARRQRRSRYRIDVHMRARIDHTMVRVEGIDITPDGIAVDAPDAAAVGTELVFLTRLPDVHGVLWPVHLPAEVRSSVREPAGHWRLGCQFVDLDDVTHERLVEFCDVVLPGEQLGKLRTPPLPLRRRTRRAG
jgi:cellulose synthase (UDP-forming)